MFADFQCPFCAWASDLLLNEVLPAGGRNGRLVLRHFPLRMHAWARRAAEATACAHEQSDQYFRSVHNYLFEHQREITPDNLRSKLEAQAATLSGFDVADLEACLDRTAVKIEQDVALDIELGVSTVFINGQMMTGIQPEQIRTYIREMTAERTRN